MSAAPTTNEQTRSARLIVDLDAVRANWRLYADLSPGCEAAAVIKADAYGMGVDKVAPALATAGARTFFTATLGEGLQARAILGDGPDIFVLEGVTEASVRQFAPARLFPVLNDLTQITLWRAAGAGIGAALHVDTGMHRLGLPPAETGSAREALARMDVKLVMSHLACASAPGHPLNAIQRDRFLTAAALFSEARKSLAASAGALLGGAYRFGLLRPGIGLYGDDGMDAPTLALAPVATLEAPILQLRDLNPGDTVGYGASFTAQKRIRSATIALGYADGYLRAGAAQGYGVLAGARCPILGRISMDLITLDVSAAGTAAEIGAPVEMLGAQVPLKDVAQAAGTITYEVLTNLGRLPRALRGAGA
jgi:alanine racemase